VVLDELGRLSKLSERLLILAAADHPGLLSPGSIDVAGLVADLERRWTPAAVRAWSFECGAEGRLTADRDRLGIALDALIENAVKFTAPGDSIAVRVGRRGDSLAIEVIDDGEGIDPQQLPRVFDRFSRADGDRTRGGGGTGLGLAIVRAIVEAHGGTVAARSRPGRGSTFSLLLPGFESTAASAKPGGGTGDHASVAASAEPIS
jgi:signal transduction histidine kinase